MPVSHSHVGHVCVRYLGVVSFVLGWIFITCESIMASQERNRTVSLHRIAARLCKLLTCIDLPRFGKLLEVMSEGLPLECRVLTWVKLLTTTT